MSITTRASTVYSVKETIIKRIITLLSMGLVSSALALVSIAPVDIGSKPGFSGIITGSLTTTGGNTEKEYYTLGTRMQYDQGSNYLTWLMLNYSYGKYSGVKNEDALYGHWRYLHTFFVDDLNIEGFVQSEQNIFKELQERTLVGGNLRYRFLNSSQFGKGYVGLGAFNETINYISSATNPNETNTRLNSYIAYTLKFDAKSKLSYVGYYQPKADNFSDYATLQSLELSLPVYKSLSLSIVGKYIHDECPPDQVLRDDHSIVTQLVLEL